MAAVVTVHDVAYLPKPNRVEVHLTDQLAPSDLCRTAFCIPICDEGSVTMALNQRRGVESPGGHIDPGEDAEQAGQREAYEETGTLVGDVRPIGYLKLISEGEVPDGWPYPHPIGYQQFFAGRVIRREDYIPNAECTKPLILEPCQVSALLAHKPTTRAFVEEAMRIMSI